MSNPLPPTGNHAASPAIEGGASFEKAIERLQGLLKQMESGDLSLEDSLKAFEEGVTLVRGCQESLRAAELRVEQLFRQRADGSPEFQTVGPMGNQGAGGNGPQGPRG
jgi:exodeoxyribonuclease VII small subunit